MKLRKIYKQKKNIKNLLKKILLLEGCVSVSVVGSFAENKDISNIGDLDIVVISNTISKIFLKKCKSLIKKHKFQTKKKVKINNSFGPVKYNNFFFFTVHLMVYDIKGHIDHVIKSPFTCYDWERKNINLGKSLTEIYPVDKLQLIDFFNSRRAVNNHYKDIKDEVVSTYSYRFTKKGYSLEHKKIKLNKLNKLSYCKHICNHTINNFYKFVTQKNSKIKKNTLKNFLSSQNLENTFSKKINNLNDNKAQTTINNTKMFLNKFFLRLKHIKKQSNTISFIRHAKTRFNNNSFLGRKRNVSIISFKNKDKFNYDEILCSPLLRSIQTAKKFRSKKITIKNVLTEINYGDAEGLNIKQLKHLYPKMIKDWSLKKDPKFPKGENLSMVLNRVNKFIKFLSLNLKNKKSKKYLIITHNVFIRCLLGSFFRIKCSDWFKLKINHLSKFDFILLNGKIIPNIDRKTLKKVMNYKINELSSIN